MTLQDSKADTSENSYILTRRPAANVGGLFWTSCSQLCGPGATTFSYKKSSEKIRGIDACVQASLKPPRELAATIMQRRNLRVRLAEEWGRHGGRSRGKKLPPEQRREQARLAAKARWSKPTLVELTPASSRRPR
jgi:hypothetical protein